MWAKYNQQRGFTIVELLIVIVVISILAAITVVAYTGVQERSRDSNRKTDLAQIATALRLYHIDNGPMSTGSGCGYAGNGAGWYHSDYDGAGPLLSISQCLINSGHLTKSITDPQAQKGCTAVPNTTPTENECFYYMRYECGGGTYVYANLESMPHSTTDTDAGCMATLDSVYGMNYYVRVN